MCVCVCVGGTGNEKNRLLKGRVLGDFCAGGEGRGGVWGVGVCVCGGGGTGNEKNRCQFHYFSNTCMTSHLPESAVSDGCQNTAYV